VRWPPAWELVSWSNEWFVRQLPASKDVWEHPTIIQTSRLLASIAVIQTAKLLASTTVEWTSILLGQQTPRGQRQAVLYTAVRHSLPELQHRR
jgi:hypothetical protein